MSQEVVLCNYSVYNQFLIWNGSTCEPVKDDKTKNQEQGIVGYTENQELVGVFIRNSKVFFLHNNNEYEINISNFKCTNDYVDKKLRHFQLEIQGKLIYELIYEPYIDPGMLMYDADFEEFDILLFLANNILENQEILENYFISYAI